MSNQKSKIKRQNNRTALTYNKKSSLRSFSLFFKTRLHGKAFTATAGAACVWIIEIKSFAVQSVRKIEHGIYQVEEAFQICHHLHPIVFKHLVHGFLLVVEVELVGKPGNTRPLPRLPLQSRMDRWRCRLLPSAAGPWLSPYRKHKLHYLLTPY